MGNLITMSAKKKETPKGRTKSKLEH